MAALVFVLLGGGMASATLTHVRSLAGPIPSVFGMRILPLGGTQALISAPYYCSGGTACTGFMASGAAYRVDVTSGAILQTFLNPTPGVFDVFGFGSAAAGGEFFVSAMLDDDDGGAENSGTVYVFNAASGSPTGSIARPVPLAGAYFGYALTSDATHVLIGAYGGGTVYLLDAATLSVVRTYVDPDPVGDSKSFGQALAMDADTVVVGMPEGHVASTPETGLWPGTVHVYERSSGGLLYTLEPPAGVLSGFGLSVLLEGPRLVVSSGQGLFVYDVASGTLERTIPDPTTGEGSWFGISLAMLDEQIVVGASGTPDGGTAYLVDRATGTVTQAVGNPAPATAPGLGLAVATLGGSVLAGTGSVENPPPTVPGVFVFAPCGDATVNPGEECDDGNVATGDGCSDRCSWDSTPTTTSSPSTTSTSTSTSTTTTTPPDAGNAPPIAVVPPSYLSEVGDHVIFDGSTSNDRERSPLSFAWTLLEKPATSNASLLHVTTSTPLLIPDALGTYRVRLVVGDGMQESQPAIAVLTVSPAGSGVQLAITEPQSDATLTGSHAIVRGTVEGPPNVGVMVNGSAASVEGGVFLARVPLQAGPNQIVATAAIVDGQAARVAETVTSIPSPQLLKLSVRLGSGVVPLPATFSFVRTSSVPIQTLAMDFDGDGSDDLVTSDPDAPLQTVYTNPGLYLARLRLTAANGDVAEAMTVVAAHDPATMDAMFTGLWTGMLLRLSAGDRAGAEAYLDPKARTKYAPVFTTLSADLPSIVAGFGPIKGRALGDRIAEYFVRRTIDGRPRVFFVYFLLNADGVWRIAAM